MILTIFLIFLWVCIACLAGVFFKNASGLGDVKFLYGFLLYCVTAVLALFTFRRIEFGSMTILWVAMSLLLGLLISVFYYHEKFTLVTGISAFLTLIVIVLIGGK